MSLIAPCPPPPAKRLFLPPQRESASSSAAPSPQTWFWRGAAVTMFLVGLGVFSAVVFERFVGAG